MMLGSDRISGTLLEEPFHSTMRTPAQSPVPSADIWPLRNAHRLILRARPMSPQIVRTAAVLLFRSLGLMLVKLESHTCSWCHALLTFKVPQDLSLRFVPGLCRCSICIFQVSNTCTRARVGSQGSGFLAVVLGFGVDKG